MLRRSLVKKILLLVACFAPALLYAQLLEPPFNPKKVVPYVPTGPETVSAMLKLASVGKNDLVMDLGCGDGRIVIAAAKEYGAHGIGVDIDPQRIREAKENAQKEGVENLVEFRVGDLFEADIRKATVVTLYLLPSVNMKLRPKLWHDLKPGTRVVSHTFDMEDWKPEKVEEVGGSEIFLWVIKARSEP
jgi:2-polyprenyl-3-methyl-5-hydroxy-6-metoxy-1,4-benzoquinol methylase